MTKRNFAEHELMLVARTILHRTCPLRFMMSQFFSLHVHVYLSRGPVAYTNRKTDGQTIQVCGLLDYVC